MEDLLFLQETLKKIVDICLMEKPRFKAVNLDSHLIEILGLVIRIEKNLVLKFSRRYYGRNQKEREGICRSRDQVNHFREPGANAYIYLSIYNL